MFPVDLQTVDQSIESKNGSSMKFNQSRTCQRCRKEARSLRNEKMMLKRCTWDHLGLSKRWFDVWSTNYSISHLISGYIWLVVSNMFYFPYFSIIYGIIMRIHQDIHHSHSFSLSVVEWSKMPPGAPGNDHGVPTASGSCGHGRLTSAPGRKGRDNSQSNLVIDPGKPAAEVSQT